MRLRPIDGKPGIPERIGNISIGKWTLKNSLFPVFDREANPVDCFINQPICSKMRIERNPSQHHYGKQTNNFFVSIVSGQTLQQV